MNVIVSNKQKNLLDNANIDAIKDLSGLFNVDELINNFKDYFFSRMVIDATSIVDFAKENVLRKLVSGIGAEKIVLFLPKKPEPPQKFLDLLVSLGIYNYTTDIEEVVRMLKDPKTADNFRTNQNVGDENINKPLEINNNVNTSNDNEVNNINKSSETNPMIVDKNNDRKIVVGFKNVTMHAGSTTLIYMVKQHLEKDFNVSVEAFEIGSSDFMYFNVPGMRSVNPVNLEESINNSKANIILLDMNTNNYDSLCDDVIYLIEPSILNVNRLLAEKRNIFAALQDKKVVLNKSTLTNNDVSIFAKEAGIRICYNMPFINDRIKNNVVNDFIDTVGIVNNGVRGLFSFFK